MIGFNVIIAVVGLLVAGVGLWVSITGKIPVVTRSDSGRPSPFWRWSGVAWLLAGVWVAASEALLALNQPHVAAVLGGLYVVALIVISFIAARAAQQRSL